MGNHVLCVMISVINIHVFDRDQWTCKIMNFLRESLCGSKESECNLSSGVKPSAVEI